MNTNFHVDGNGVVETKGLSKEQFEQIVQLASQCALHDGFDLSVTLNLPMLQNRSSEQINDFLYYEAGQLVGFLGMYAIVREDEVEISGMVHPQFRRKGIFRTLYAQAKKECAKRNVTQMLLVCHQASESAKSFMKAVSATYQFSEYKLDYSAPLAKQPLMQENEVSVVAATEDDFETLVAIGVSGFGDTVEQMSALVKRNLSEPQHQIYLAHAENMPVGMITATEEADSIYLSAFCVRKDLQGKGLGRTILTQMVELLKRDNPKTLSLDVAIDNLNALSLYQSAGFVVDSGYDYYLG